MNSALKFLTLLSFLLFALYLFRLAGAGKLFVVEEWMVYRFFVLGVCFCVCAQGDPIGGQSIYGKSIQFVNTGEIAVAESFQGVQV
jgi:hypothetical protein